jgi:hypothetical protein
MTPIWELLPNNIINKFLEHFKLVLSDLLIISEFHQCPILRMSTIVLFQLHGNTTRAKCLSPK